MILTSISPLFRRTYANLYNVVIVEERNSSPVAAPVVQVESKDVEMEDKEVSTPLEQQ